MRHKDPVNRAMIAMVARSLGDLLSEVVFIGGTTVSLHIDDAAIQNFRPTTDVDCVIDVATQMEMSKVEEQLRKKGFQPSFEDGVICRYLLNSIKVDFMPTDERILGFTNIWYQEGFKNPIAVEIEENLIINTFQTQYFLATKMEAFKGRGKGDFDASHDLEDFFAVLDGRVNLEQLHLEFNNAIRNYFSIEFSKLLANEKFQDRLPGYIDPVYNRFRALRTKRILDFMSKVATKS